MVGFKRLIKSVLFTISCLKDQFLVDETTILLCSLLLCCFPFLCLVDLIFEEINVLYSTPNIVRGTKSRKMRWAGHVALMAEGEACTGFWWGNVGERDNWGDSGINGRIILRWIFRKWNLWIWTRSRWLRIGTGGGHL
jgi:hypothetical protein